MRLRSCVKTVQFFSIDRDRYSLRFISFVIALLIIVGASNLSLVAQGPLQWSPQDRIPGYDPLVNTPYLIADQNRTVHAFNSNWIEDQQVIVYSQWTLEQGWTEPIDILLPQLHQQIRLKGAILDQAGLVHLLFFSGDDRTANIYYSSAPLVHAGRARAWSKPRVIGDRARTPDEAAFVMNSKNQLFMLYSSDSAGPGLYYTYSTDEGTTWSEPVPMFLTYSNELFPFFLQMYVDKQDGVHALWNVNNPSGLGEAFYYAKSEAGQVEWNEPIKFEAGGLNQQSIIEYENELMLIYHADGEGGLTRYMRRSRDGGRTWTEKIRLFPHVGSNGPASLVIDSNNVLHMLFGNRVTVGNQIIHGMWHSVWLGAVWSTPEAVVSGPSIIDLDEIGGEGFDPSFANAIVSQGNVILTTWSTDPAAGQNGAWYSYTTLDTSELPIVPQPEFSATPTATLTVTSTPPSPTPPAPLPPVVVERKEEVSASSFASNPAAPLIYGTVPVVLLLSVVFVVRRLRRNPY